MVFVQTINNASVKIGGGDRTSPGYVSIAVGEGAGSNLQGIGSVALGAGAGMENQGNACLATGFYAGSNLQGQHSTAVGTFAGYSNQGAYAVAIGDSAGKLNQGSYTVAIGSGAGTLNQPSFTTVINASGSNLEPNNGSALYISPIRNAVETSYMLSYTGSKEIIQSSRFAMNGAGVISIGNRVTVNDDASNVVVVNGNVAANYFKGDGSLLASNTTANIVSVSSQYDANYLGTVNVYDIDIFQRKVTNTSNIILFSNTSYVDRMFFNISNIGNNDTYKVSIPVFTTGNVNSSYGNNLFQPNVYYLPSPSPTLSVRTIGIYTIEKIPGVGRPMVSIVKYLM